MIVIGVTGGVGTGKSTVARLFRRQGAVVLDADALTHELMRPGQPVWRRIRSSFGKGILRPDGRIDRRRLGTIVFGHPGRLRRLSRIVHPAVRRRIRLELARMRRRRPRTVVVLDIPLLLEAGSAYPVDAVVVVSAPLKVSARRLRARSGWTLAEVRRRRTYQLPLKEKERMADFVIDNGGSLAATRRQVERVWKQIVG